MKRIALLACFAAAPALADLRAVFDAGPEGWRVFNIGMNGHVSGVVPVAEAPWESSTQSLRVTDLTSETCIGAPDSWLGSRSGAYGRTLSFDATYRFADNADYSALVLRGASITLYYPAPHPTLNAPFRRVIPLTEIGWHVNADNGPTATVSQMRDVLADLRGLYIRTEWNTGPDDTSIDNILLTGTGGCVADVDDGSGTGTSDGGVTIDDLLYYLQLFADGTAPADIDDGTGTGTRDGGVTIDDLLYYLLRFEAGC